MGNIAHLRNQFKSINTFAQNLESYDYIRTNVDFRKEYTGYSFS